MKHLALILICALFSLTANAFETARLSIQQQTTIINKMFTAELDTTDSWPKNKEGIRNTVKKGYKSAFDGNLKSVQTYFHCSVVSYDKKTGNQTLDCNLSRTSDEYAEGLRATVIYNWTNKTIEVGKVKIVIAG